MIKGPGLFTDIGQKAKDLLTKDYNSDKKFSVSTYSDAGVALTSTAVKKGGLNTGDVAAQYNYKNTLFDVKVDTESNISTALIFTEILPSTKTIASFKVPDYNFAVTMAVALNQAPAVDLSATIVTPAFAFGVDAGYDTTSRRFSKYNAGISVTKLDSCAFIILGDKGGYLLVSYVHHLDELKKTAAVGEVSTRFSTNGNTFTVGSLCAVDHLTTVKVVPKSLVTISGEIDTKTLDKYPRFGL